VIFHVDPDLLLEIGTIELVDWTRTKARTGPDDPELKMLIKINMILI